MASGRRVAALGWPLRATLGRPGLPIRRRLSSRRSAPAACTPVGGSWTCPWLESVGFSSRFASPRLPAGSPLAGRPRRPGAAALSAWRLRCRPLRPGVVLVPATRPVPASGPAARSCARAASSRSPVGRTGGARLLRRFGHRSSVPATRQRPAALFELAGRYLHEYSGDVLLSQGATPQVPSALAGLTSVFGMGTGVTPPLWPPETVLTVLRGGQTAAPVSVP